MDFDTFVVKIELISEAIPFPFEKCSVMNPNHDYMKQYRTVFFNHKTGRFRKVTHILISENSVFIFFSCREKKQN